MTPAAWWLAGLLTPPVTLAALVIAATTYGHHLNRQARTQRLRRPL